MQQKASPSRMLLEPTSPSSPPTQSHKPSPPPAPPVKSPRGVKREEEVCLRLKAAEDLMANRGGAAIVLDESCLTVNAETESQKRQIRRKRSRKDFKGAFETSGTKSLRGLEVVVLRGEQKPRRASTPAQVTGKLSPPRRTKRDAGDEANRVGGGGVPMVMSPTSSINPAITASLPPPVPVSSASPLAPPPQPDDIITDARQTVPHPSSSSPPNPSHDITTTPPTEILTTPHPRPPPTSIDQRTWSTALASSVGSVPWTRIRQGYIDYDNASNSDGSHEAASLDEERGEMVDRTPGGVAQGDEPFLVAGGADIPSGRRPPWMVREAGMACLPSRGSPGRAEKRPSPLGSSPASVPPDHTTTTTITTTSPSIPPGLPIASPPSLPYYVWNGDHPPPTSLPRRNLYVKDLMSDPEEFPYPRGSEDVQFVVEDDSRRFQKGFSGALLPPSSRTRRGFSTWLGRSLLRSDDLETKGDEELGKRVNHLGWVRRGVRTVGGAVVRHSDWVALMITLTFSVVVAAVVGFLMREQDRRGAWGELEGACEGLGRGFANTFLTLLSTFPLQAASLMVSTNGTLTRPSFSDAITASRTVSSALHGIDALAVGWAPLITTNQDRLDWEANGYPFLSINETTGLLVREAGPNGTETEGIEYLTVQYVHSDGESYLNPGFNLLTDQNYGSRSKAVARARTSGNVTLTHRLQPLMTSINTTNTLPTPTTDPVLMAVVPVFSLPIVSPQPATSQSPFPRNTINTQPVNLTLIQTNGLWGVMVATFSPSSLLSRAVWEAFGGREVAGTVNGMNSSAALVGGGGYGFGALEIGGRRFGGDEFEVWVFDRDAPVGMEVIARYGDVKESNVVRTPEDISSYWKRQIDLTVAGSRWTLVLVATDKFGDQRRSRLYILIPVLVVCTALSGILIRWILSATNLPQKGSETHLPTHSAAAREEQQPQQPQYPQMHQHQIGARNLCLS
ncbi:hypothetical protein HDU67_007661 [Dinochytrium kinnereticum]|nr:hypothetical protein HDU67_007661 [Dinochytrium kinnereticum]